MFSALGRFAYRYKFVILAFWLLLAAALIITAPKLSKVGVTDQSQFLPDDTESAHARDLLNTKFQTSTTSSSSSALIVVYNESGLSQEDMDHAKNIHDWLISPNAPPVIDNVTSIFENEALRSSLVSQDGTTMIIEIGFSMPSLDDAVKQAVSDIRSQFTTQPGTTFCLTGNTGLLVDLFNSVQRAIDKTTLVTIILVIILLLIVYRSPVAAMVPLVAIGVSFLVSRGVVGFLAQSGVAISTITDAYLVVTIFGVGTDYCLFIVSRFREELAMGDRELGTESTMQHIGPVIAASAATVIAAFLCLGISHFSMTRTSGWALAIGIAITLLAGLTLIPALMSIFGRFLFWPTRGLPAPKSKQSGWTAIGDWVSRHPALTALPIIIILAVPYLALPHMKLSANVLSQISQDVESARGINVVRDHFPPGELSPIYLLLQSKESLLTPDSRQEIANVAKMLGGINSLSRVDYFGTPGTKLAELELQARVQAGLMTNVSPALLSQVSSLSSAANELQNIAIQYPGVVQSTNFTKATADLTQLSAMLKQVLTAPPAKIPEILTQSRELLYDFSDTVAALNEEFQLNGDSAFVKWLKTHYFSTDGTVTRMNLILKTDPNSDNASIAVDRVRDAATAAVSATGLTGADHYIGGDAAVHDDMLKTSDQDFVRVLIMASAGILVIIIILLRCLLAPLYMVLTVLFNFGATLGITVWVFLDILKEPNLTYMLPVFVFVMLAAVGADYNIFLVSRMREECGQKSTREAIKDAVSHTGGVITSCGIILAGTFATLTTSSLPMVYQIGAPIAIGVLVDTFLVRALLVPSLASLVGRWSWWPSRLSRRRRGRWDY
jgi:RND superfamily putative drug exporter